MKIIADSMDYPANLPFAEKLIESIGNEDFINVRFSRDETHCAKAIVILSFQPPQKWPIGNYGIPIPLSHAHLNLRNDLAAAMRTLKAVALEKLAFMRKYHPDILEKTQKTIR